MTGMATEPETEPGYDPAAAAAAMPTRSGISEAAIATQVDKAFGFYEQCYVINTHGDAASHGGTPDRLGVCRGRSLAIEIKRPGMRPTRRQMAELRGWQACGALVGWVESAADVHALMAHLFDREWTNPLTGPGDPTQGDDTHAGQAIAQAGTAGGP